MDITDTLTLTRIKPLAPMALAALFEDYFSIDWIMEMTDMRPTEILGEFEAGVEAGSLERVGAGRFRFSDPEEKIRRQGEFSPQALEELHRRIADTLLRDLPNEPDKTWKVAFHLLQTKNDEEGCRRLLRAGETLVKDFQILKAQKCFNKIMDDLSADTSAERSELYIQTAVNYSKISTNLDIPLENKILHEALKRARKRDSRSAEALLEMHLAKNEWLSNRYNSALKRFNTGWALTREQNDPKLLRTVTTFITFFLYWQGRFKEVVNHYEKAVPDVERNADGGFPLLAAITVAHCYAHINQVSQGLGMADAIRSLCMERGDRFLAPYAVGAMGNIMLDIRRVDDALHYLETSADLFREEQNMWLEMLGLVCLAFAYHLKGAQKRSTTLLRRYVKLSGKSKATVRHVPFLLDLSWAMEQGELPPVPGISFEREVTHTLNSQNLFMKGVAQRYQALSLRKQGKNSEVVLEALLLSESWLEESGHQVELSRARLELAREYLSLNRDPEARDMVQKASDVLTPLNEDMVPSDLKSLLDVSPQSYDRHFRDILRLGQEVVTMRDNRDLVQHILSTVNRITGAERGAIFLLEDVDGPMKLQLRASKNLTAEHVAAPGFDSSLKMIERVAGTGRPSILGAGEADAPGRSSGEVIRSRICVPMVLRDKVVGVLYHDNRLLSSAFKESDLELLAYFAGQAAFALDNAAAYEEIRRLNVTLREEKEYFEEQHLKSLHFENIIGQSAAIMDLMAQIDKVAATDTTILILGETGVGKELVASAIHRHSLRQDKPFIRANCGALTETLITSELFGHEKGAFTGANNRRIGRFELANGGTIFLDEIGELPLDVQVRLLRVLQNGEFERVGGSGALRSDFRLIAATNRNLEQAVQDKSFRPDLYYRLNVFPLFVPPLRERKEDIPLLAQYFLEIYGNKLGKKFNSLPEKELDKLMGYHWPGNVRELENIIERGSILSRPGRFQAPQLSGRRIGADQADRPVTLKDVERQHIIWALQKTGWKVRGTGGAAELLDVHPSTLAFKMKKLEIVRPPKFAKRGKPRKNASPAAGE